MTTLVPNSPALIAGVIIVMVMALAGFFAPLVAPHNPAEVGLKNRKGAPSAGYPFGTDNLGRDVLSRSLFSLRFTAISGALALVLGTGGAWAIATGQASRGTPPSTQSLLGVSILRLSGLVWLSMLPFPLLVVAILGTGLLQVGLITVLFSSILAMALVYQSVGMTLSTGWRTESFPSDEEGKPNIVQTALKSSLNLAPVAFCISLLMGLFIEVPLSFLGFGLPPDVPSLGGMIAEGRNVLVSVWWLSLFPLGIMTIAVGAFLAIVLPIRRVQKQIEVTTRPEPGLIYPGFWVRMASIAIDVVVLIVIALIFQILKIIGLPETLGQGIFIAVEVLYTLVFLGGYKDSLGHRLFRIRVVRSNGERMGFGQSLLRGSLIFGFSLCVLAIVFSRRRRALYDMLSNTVVIKRRYTQPAQNMMEEPGRPTACPQCGQPTEGDNNFCNQCGAQLGR